MSIESRGRAELAQLPEEGEAEDLGEVAGRRLAAVRPDPQPLPGRGEEGGAEGPAVPVAAVGGVDDELGGGGLDRVGVLQLGVPGECSVGGEQEVPDALAVLAPELEPPLLGDRLPAVGPGRLAEEGQDGVGLLGGERVEGLDRTAGGGEGYVSRHGYERTGRGWGVPCRRVRLRGNGPTVRVRGPTRLPRSRARCSRTGRW